MKLSNQGKVSCHLSCFEHSNKDVTSCAPKRSYFIVGAFCWEMSPVLKRDMTGVLWVRVCVVLQMCLSAVLPASSSPVKNYYDRLNVEPTATDNQIKDNFRKLAMKYHPDKSKSVDAETKFREIAEGKQKNFVFCLVKDETDKIPVIQITSWGKSMANP